MTVLDDPRALDAPPDPLAAPPELVRVATAGSVDDGKSTLIGRLLHDTRSVLADQLEAVRRTSLERGDGRLDLALLTDGLRAEREQGITIDVAYRFFTTPRRSFVLADTPGHVRYTRNMVTGASTADVALVLVDARLGVLEQSRRHAAIAALLRVPHVVAVVNKMDLVGFDGEAFARIAAEFRAFAERLGAPEVAAVPVSALHGDGVVERSERLGWYDGPPLLELLEGIDVARDRAASSARFPVQWVVRPHDDAHHDYRGYAGQVAGGTLRPGDEVVVLPSGERTRIAALDTFDGPVDEAPAPMSVTVRLADELDVARGQTLADPADPPVVTRELVADLCWFAEEPLRAGARLLVQHTTKVTGARVAALEHRTDVTTLARLPAPEALALNDTGRVRLRTTAPLAVDRYADSRATGALVLIDPATNATVAAGMVADAVPVEPTPRSPDVTRHAGGVSRAHRWAALGRRGATLWLTGLPASGKSTLATALEARLLDRGIAAYNLDGDDVRHGLSGDLGFGTAAREENVRRVGEVARLMADAGQLVIVSLVSPLAGARDRVRARHEDDRLPFLEVWVDTPLAECERRDPKGLYRRARAGELAGFTGVDDPYQPPSGAELVLAGGEALETALARLEGLLHARGLLDA